MDPGIKVLWPSFVEWSSGVTVWQNNSVYGHASDGAGGTGKDWADGFAFHFYSYSTEVEYVDGLPRDGEEDDGRGRQAELGDVQHRDGLRRRLCGDPNDATKAVLVQRWMALNAAYGLKVAVLYSHDGSNLGSPATNPTMAAAINQAHVQLTGKTIREAGVLQDGRVFVVFGDNSTWVI